MNRWVGLVLIFLSAVLCVLPSAPRVRRALPAVRTRRARSIDRAGDAPRIVARARRVLFGDGTYRPEPFPRPTR
jgi:hypothetical protein